MWKFHNLLNYIKISQKVRIDFTNNFPKGRNVTFGRETAVKHSYHTIHNQIEPF